jgi:hypothetical protein
MDALFVFQSFFLASSRRSFAFGRTKFVNEAMKTRDVKSLAAVLGAHSHLSGLNPEMQLAWTRQWNEMSYPEASKRLTTTRKARALLEERGPLVFAQVTKALGGHPWESIKKKIRFASSEAEKALLFKDGNAG